LGLNKLPRKIRKKAKAAMPVFGTKRQARAKPSGPLPASKARFVEPNLGLVEERARRIFSAHREICESLKIEFNDCIQEGVVGLIAAIKRGNPSRQGFRTYTIKAIDGQILDLLRERAPLIKLASQVQRVIQNKKAFEKYKGVLIKRAESAKFEGVRKQAKSILHGLMAAEATQKPVSGSKPFFSKEEGKKVELFDTIQSEKPGPAILFEQAELRQKILHILSKLPGKRGEVMELRFLGPKPLTMKETADILKIGESTVSQLQNEAIKDLLRTREFCRLFGVNPSEKRLSQKQAVEISRKLSKAFKTSSFKHKSFG